jgi:hypothetical protein
MSRKGMGCCAQMSAVSRTRFASCVFIDVVKSWAEGGLQRSELRIDSPASKPNRSA